MDKQTTWLDVMPHIGVTMGAIMRSRIDYSITTVCVGVFESGTGFYSEGPREERNAEWMVDLDSAIGFGYALRHYQTQHGGAIRWVARWMNDETTDGDRLALAEALAELAKAAA